MTYRRVLNSDSSTVLSCPVCGDMKVFFNSESESVIGGSVAQMSIFVCANSHAFSVMHTTLKAPLESRAGRLDQPRLEQIRIARANHRIARWEMHILSWERQALIAKNKTSWNELSITLAALRDTLSAFAKISSPRVARTVSRLPATPRST